MEIKLAEQARQDEMCMQQHALSCMPASTSAAWRRLSSPWLGLGPDRVANDSMLTHVEASFGNTVAQACRVHQDHLLASWACRTGSLSMTRETATRGRYIDDCSGGAFHQQVQCGAYYTEWSQHIDLESV